MGATGWEYAVRYQPDMNAALQELRQDVFRRGDYQTGPTVEEIKSIEANFSPKMKALYEMAKRWEPNERPKPTPLRPPETIDELIDRVEESGTHSILDIDHIASAAEFGALRPLSDEELLDIFGTTQPTRADLERWKKRIPSVNETRLYRRWEGIAITLYQEGVPEEYYFEGASGD